MVGAQKAVETRKPSHGEPFQDFSGTAVFASPSETGPARSLR